VLAFSVQFVSRFGMSEWGHSELLAFWWVLLRFKRKFIENVVCSRVGDRSCCMFEDIGGLHVGRAHCSTHNQECAITAELAGTIFACGFSCKDFSRLCNTWSGAERASILANAAGTSGSTFHALLQHARASHPCALLMENAGPLVVIASGVLVRTRFLMVRIVLTMLVCSAWPTRNAWCC